MQLQSTERTVSPASIVESLKKRLDFHNIYRESALVMHMTPALQIQIKWFQALDLLSHKSELEIQTLLKKLPFVKVRQNEAGKTMIKFQYKLPPTLIIVTGIYDDSLTKLLYTYNQFAKKNPHSQGCKELIARRTHYNGFFTLIEAYCKENAESLKGYLRNRKKLLEDRTSTQFKMENRRVRIFSAAEEELFTFIVDIMSEYKSQKFYKCMEADLTRKSMSFMPPGSPIYRLFSTATIPIRQMLQTDPKENQPSTYEAETGREEMCWRGQRQFTKEEDDSSDSTCFTSEILDKFQDIGEEIVFKTNEVFFSVQQGAEGRE